MKRFILSLVLALLAVVFMANTSFADSNVVRLDPDILSDIRYYEPPSAGLYNSGTDTFLKVTGIGNKEFENPSGWWEWSNPEIKIHLELPAGKTWTIPTLGITYDGAGNLSYQEAKCVEGCWMFYPGSTTFMQVTENYEGYKAPDAVITQKSYYTDGVNHYAWRWTARTDDTKIYLDVYSVNALKTQPDNLPVRFNTKFDGKGIGPASMDWKVGEVLTATQVIYDWVPEKSDGEWTLVMGIWRSTELQRQDGKKYLFTSPADMEIWEPCLEDMSCFRLGSNYPKENEVGRRYYISPATLYYRSLKLQTDPVARLPLELELWWTTSRLAEKNAYMKTGVISGTITISDTSYIGLADGTYIPLDSRFKPTDGAKVMTIIYTDSFWQSKGGNPQFPTSLPKVMAVIEVDSLKDTFQWVGTWWFNYRFECRTGQGTCDPWKRW